MRAEPIFLVSIGLTIVLAGIAVWRYHRIDFPVHRHERGLIKAAIVLNPLYAILEFGLLPASVVPEAVLAATGVVLGFAFHEFRKRVIDR